MFSPVSNRYERASMIVTSNKPFSKCGEIFGDDMGATAMIDRLIHHSEILNGDELSRRFMATLCFHLEENMSPLRARSARGHTSLNPMRSGRLRSGGDRLGFGPRERDGQLPA
jgi:hypothetical protein